MDKRTAQYLNVEVVLIGYYDPRIDGGAPFGFALKADDQVVVYHRKDITDFALPKSFGFTARNLAGIIAKACGKGKVQTDLFTFLLHNCFDGLGSFRCWQPIREKVKPQDMDGYVLAIRRMVDQEMREYAEELQDFKESCTPDWDRTPEPKAPQMPSLAPA